MSSDLWGGNGRRAYLKGIATVSAGACTLLAGCWDQDTEGFHRVEVQNETASVQSVSVDVLDEDDSVVFDESLELLPGEQKEAIRVSNSQATYTTRVHKDGERTRSQEWDVQVAGEMLVRIRDSGVTFAPDGCPSGSDERGPSIELYNLTGDEITGHLTVEKRGETEATEDSDGRRNTPLPESYTPTSTAGWSTLIHEDINLTERSDGGSTREYCEIGEGRTSIQVSAGDGHEGSRVFDVPGRSFKLLVILFEKELMLTKTYFCHFGC
jgi:hypothetical protein